MFKWFRKRKLEEDPENGVSNSKARRSAGSEQGGSSPGEQVDLQQEQRTASKPPLQRKSARSGQVKPSNAFAKLYNSPRRKAAPVRLPPKPAADAGRGSADDIIEVGEVKQTATKILEKVASGSAKSKKTAGGSSTAKVATRPLSRRSAPEKLLPHAAKPSKPTASKNSDTPSKSSSRTSSVSKASKASAPSESATIAPVAILQTQQQQNPDDMIKVK